MTAESGLKWLLRFIALTTVPAFIAGVLPQAVLAGLIEKGAPGTSTGILVTYLARVLMLMFALVGLQCLIFSTDIGRYSPLIWVLGVGTGLFAIAGLAALFLRVPPDQRAGIFWIVFADFTEGLAQAVLMVVLLLRVPPDDRFSGHSLRPAKAQ